VVGWGSISGKLFLNLGGKMDCGLYVGKLMK